MPMPKQSRIEAEKVHDETGWIVPACRSKPLFVNLPPGELDAYCEIETPYQNFFVELPFANIERSQKFLVSKARPLIELAQEFDFDVSIIGYSTLRIHHFLRWENYDPYGAVVFCELDLSVALHEEALDREGNRTCFDVYCEVRIETSEGDEIVPYARFSFDKPLRSITSAKKCLRDYAQALRTAADRPDLLVPVVRHSDLPSLKGIGERDRFRMVRITRDGEVEEHDICDLKVGTYSLRRDPNGITIRKSRIKWLSAYSKQKCGIIHIKLSSVESISPSIAQNIFATERQLLGPPKA